MLKALLPFLTTLIPKTFDYFEPLITAFFLFIAKYLQNKEALTHFFL